jgi:hypothetical protein
MVRNFRSVLVFIGSPMLIQTAVNLQVERSYRASQSVGYTNVQVTWESNNSPTQVSPFYPPSLLDKERYLIIYGY